MSAVFCNIVGHLINVVVPSFISFHFISFHFISFHFISFHFISFHFISFHFISFHFISFHFISFHCQRNYFVRKLRECNVCRTITNLFYKSTVQSVLCYCLICWGGSLSVKNRVLLDRVVRSASKNIGSTRPTVDEFYETCIYDEKKKGHLKGHFSPIARILLCCTIWL